MQSSWFKYLVKSKGKYRPNLLTVIGVIVYAIGFFFAMFTGSKDSTILGIGFGISVLGYVLGYFFDKPESNNSN